MWPRVSLYFQRSLSLSILPSVPRGSVGIPIAIMTRCETNGHFGVCPSLHVWAPAVKERREVEATKNHLLLRSIRSKLMLLHIGIYSPPHSYNKFRFILSTIDSLFKILS